MGLESIDQPGQSSEVEYNPKTSISFFDDFGGLFLHFSRLLLLGSLGQSLEVERNPKMSISSYDDLGGLFHISVEFHHSECSADHQKLNVSKTSISFFDDLGGLFCISVDFCCLDHLANHQKLNVI